MSAKTSRKHSGKIQLPLLAGLLATGLTATLMAQSVPFPTYQVGQNQTGTQGPDYPSTLPNPWVVSSGQIITPTGIQVNLGTTTRAKAIALNPTGNHTAAVLQMGAPQAVTVFNTQTGAVLQTYKPFRSASGSATGIAYTPDGTRLLFSQDSSFVAIANVNATTGLLTDAFHVSVPVNLTNITCFSNSPPGTTGSAAIPCGTLVGNSSYPLGIAITPDNKTAVVVLDANDTLAKIDLTAATPVEGPQIRVGNVPHSVIISPDGTTAYVSNEAGRVATMSDFQEYSDGTPVVAANPTGSISTGNISVVNISTMTVTATINTGLHPTGMAWWGNKLLVANAYDDTIGVIDPSTNQMISTIPMTLPLIVPNAIPAPYGAYPNSIAVDQVNNVAYVALYDANAIAVVQLQNPAGVMGMIPVGYAPSSVVLDKTDNVLLVANDKGIGTTGIPGENSTVTSHGSPAALNTHEDLGTVSIVPVPQPWALWNPTNQVTQNNHWDLWQSISTASGGSHWAAPVAIPAKIGDPSEIKHVFVIIRENRTYDQILGDVVGGNGQANLAVFGDGTAATTGAVTPNAHAIVQRFPLLDNFYDPSRQSADGHNWIVQAMAPYSDDIQSPDWVRDYPSNGGDALAYQNKGHLWDVAKAAGVSFKNYGEYVEYNTFLTPTGSTAEPQWIDFYNDTQAYETGAETQLYNFNTVASHTPLPNLFNATVQNYPQFDLGIPDQFRVDIWNQDFQNDVKNGTVPQLEMMWISSDHTGGPPTAVAMEADNDLALGRFVDAISHSSIWNSSVIFVEEDDAQDGVDHVDGHRSPGYVISPYVKQKVNPDGSGAGVTEDNTFYTQVNMTRTIEQILGLQPMNQFDLTASPMSEMFMDNPPAANFLPWPHVSNVIPLTQGVTETPKQPIPAAIAVVNGREMPAGSFAARSYESPAVKALRAGWMKKKAQVFAGKYHIPDSEDAVTVNHLDWYEATGFTRPYPGEKKVYSASHFNNRKAPKGDRDDD